MAKAGGDHRVARGPDAPPTLADVGLDKHLADRARGATGAKRTPPRGAVTLASGERLSLGGFRVIDEEKFMGLPDDVFLDWRQRGWIPLVYCHLLSMSNWQSLTETIGDAEEADNAS